MNCNCLISLLEVKIKDINMCFTFWQNQECFKPVRIFFNIIQYQRIPVCIMYQDSGNSLVFINFIIKWRIQICIPDIYLNPGLSLPELVNLICIEQNISYVDINDS